MAKALRVTRPGTDFTDLFEGEDLDFEIDGDGDMYITTGPKKNRIAGYSRGLWVSVIPADTKRGRRG